VGEEQWPHGQEEDTAPRTVSLCPSLPLPSFPPSLLTVRSSWALAFLGFPPKEHPTHLTLPPSLPPSLLCASC
jgi:hypothetical protein